MPTVTINITDSGTPVLDDGTGASGKSFVGQEKYPDSKRGPRFQTSSGDTYPLLDKANSTYARFNPPP